MYKYCLLFSGLQGEAEWSICATRPSFVLWAPNACQLGGRKPIRDDRRQGQLLLAPQIALSLRFCFSECAWSSPSAAFSWRQKLKLVTKRRPGFPGFPRVDGGGFCFTLRFPTWKAGSTLPPAWKGWLYGASKMPNLTPGQKRRLKPINFPKDRARRRGEV